VTEAIVLKIFDMVSVIVNENKKNVKNAPGSLRKLAMKYSVRLNDIAMMILDGRLHIIEAIASVNG
jgi:hypothetical protein